MDYVEWCDALAEGLAKFAESQPNRWVHVHQFADYFIASRQLVSNSGIEHAVILDSMEVMFACGLDNRSQGFYLKHGHLDLLRGHYDRWTRAQSISLDDHSLLLLDSLNRLSRRANNGYTTVDDVYLDAILAEVNQDPEGMRLDTDYAMELFDGLENLGLSHSQKFIGSTEYKSSYMGVARTNRAHVAADQEIDHFRTAGEGSGLDYKRHYRIKSNAEKWEFTKDVTALVNAGGLGARHLLLGVEDNGEFFRPSSADDEQEHRALLTAITETRLQQIVTSRTTHAPSLRVAARGEHRDGPYLVVAITRDVGHLPYRIYQNQATGRRPTPMNWERCGSVKAQRRLVQRQLKSQRWSNRPHSGIVRVLQGNNRQNDDPIRKGERPMDNSTSHYVFLDANIFIHFQMFDEVDWSKALDVTSVQLVLAPSVFRELDKFKEDPTNVPRRDRVRAVLRKLRTLLGAHHESGAAQVRSGVTVAVLPLEPQVDWSSLHLDQTISDDRLLASMSEFAAAHPGDSLV